MQIGQHTFHDTVHPFNPSPLVLDEATLNEWPGREVGVFVSVGTGKRPPGTDGNQAMWYEEFLGGEFVEAKRRLMQKIEGCEETHQWMVREGLAKRGVQREAYVRLNVEVGVGDFGMNEWQALSDISTSTRRYLARPDISRLTEGAAARLARVHISKRREAGLIRTQGMGAPTLQEPRYPTFAAELPAEVVPLAKPSPISSASRPSYEYDGVDTLQLPPTSTGTGNSPRTSAERLTDRERAERARVSQDSNRRSQAYASGSEHSPHNGTPPRQSPRVSDTDRFTSHAPTPSQYRTARGDDKIAIMAEDDMPRPLNNMAPPSNLPPPPPIPGDGSGGVPPPLPPKTPIPGSERDDNRRRRERRAERESRDSGRGDRKVPVLPPYPLDDVPPAVNMARKPDLRGVRR